MKFCDFNTEKHYEMACSWWISWGWSALPLHALPKNGIVIYDDDLPICLGFLYLTDSSICWVEHIVANQQANRDQRRNGVDILIQALNNRAKSLDYMLSMTSIKHKTLIAKYKNNGYTETDTNMTNMLKVL